MPSARVQKSKYWCLTHNNYTDEIYQEYCNLFANVEVVSYVCVGKEVGESGTPHLQLYLECHRRITFSQLKALVPRGNPHVERRLGTAQDAAEYCQKDGEWVEFGTRSVTNPGQRNDLVALQQAINQNDNLRVVADEHFRDFLKYSRAIHAYKNLVATPRTWQMSVIVYWGRTGAGKTRAVWENRPSDDDIYIHPGGPWFDGYGGQPIALFDDFAGNDFKLQYLLKLLDRYPMRVPVKGNFVQWKPREVYITSNINPRMWYINANGQHVEALFRRITNIVKFE